MAMRAGTRGTDASPSGPASSGPAGFSSAIVLAMTALLIGYEALSRLIAPVAIHFEEAIPIAVFGLIVNIASVLLLGGADHDHNHADHAPGSRDHDHDRAHEIDSSRGSLRLQVFAVAWRPASGCPPQPGRSPMPARSRSRRSAPTARDRSSPWPVKAATISNPLIRSPAACLHGGCQAASRRQIACSRVCAAS